MAGKILGAVLVVGACFAMGYRLSVREILRLKELLFFKGIIESILSETEHNRATFACALKTAGEGSESEVLSSVENALKNNNSVRTAWKFAFEENRDNLYLTKEDIKRFEDAGDGFNSGDMDFCKRKVNDIAMYVEAQEKIIRSRTERDKRVYRSVSLSVGLFIVLVLI